MSGSDVTPSAPRKAGPLAVRPGYEVGYAKPPEATRFQKGISGNPRGRPTGAKTKLPQLNEERMKQIVLDEAYRTIAVRDGARTVSVPMAQAIVRAMAVNAVKGQHRAQRLFTELLSRTETANRALADAYLENAMTYKIAWDRELERRRRHNITHLPEPLPHPDQIVIDARRGTAHIHGPLTKEDQAQLERFRAEKKNVAKLVADLRRGLKRETDPDEQDDIRRHITIGEDLLAKYRQAVPD